MVLEVCWHGLLNIKDGLVISRYDKVFFLFVLSLIKLLKPEKMRRYKLREITGKNNLNE